MSTSSNTRTLKSGRRFDVRAGDIDAADAALPDEAAPAPAAPDAAPAEAGDAWAEGSVESLSPRTRDVAAAGRRALAAAARKTESVLAYAKFWTDRMEAAKATRDGHESEVARLEEEILAHGAETEACRSRLREAEAAPAAPPADAGPTEEAQELTRAHIDARKAAKKQVKEQRARVDGLHGQLSPADVLECALAGDASPADLAEAILARKLRAKPELEAKVEALQSTKARRDAADDARASAEGADSAAALAADLEAFRAELLKRRAAAEARDLEAAAPKAPPAREDRSDSKKLSERAAGFRGPRKSGAGDAAAKDAAGAAAPPPDADGPPPRAGDGPAPRRPSSDDNGNRSSLVNIAFAKRSTNVLTAAKGLFGRKTATKFKKGGR